MLDERLPPYLWPLCVGIGAGVVGFGLLFGGWLGLAPYPLIAGGVLVIIAAIIGVVTR